MVPLYVRGVDLARLTIDQAAMACSFGGVYAFSRLVKGFKTCETAGSSHSPQEPASFFDSFVHSFP